MTSVLLLYLLAEVYSFFGLKILFKEGKYYVSYLIAYSISVIIPIIGFALIFNRMSKRITYDPFSDNIWMGLTLSFVVFKVFIAAFILIGDVLRGSDFVLNWVINFFDKGEGKTIKMGLLNGRREFLNTLALGFASIPFISMMYGISKGKYAYKLHKITLSFKNLPSNFEGYKIAQFSDFHAGSHDDYAAVNEGLKLMNEQDSDLILFTGDLVNDIAKEMDPFVEPFRNLSAKDGKYSILGNHDYGLYNRWESLQDKMDNFHEMITKHNDAGFQLLRNEHILIERDGQKICLAGVENWGLPPFPQYGDLDKALEHSDAPFTVLMSHDPSHFEEQIKDYSKQVDLTLSGHTHGMQLGIEMLGIKWSPVKYRYKRWAGVYEEAKRILYVNRGFGFIGFPGRVGIMPEITIIELKKG